jgi:hypothetical protein
MLAASGSITVEANACLKHLTLLPEVAAAVRREMRLEVKFVEGRRRVDT